MGEARLVVAPTPKALFSHKDTEARRPHHPWHCARLPAGTARLQPGVFFGGWCHCITSRPLAQTRRTVGRPDERTSALEC